MTSTIDNVTKVTELISKLTVEDAIGSDQTNLVLKAIKRIGCFTDSQFSAFAKTCAVEQKPLVHQLRAQAKAALVAVAGGEAKLELTDIAQKAKVEQLILAVCKEDRHLVSDIPTDEKIDVLTHAKRILPQDRSTYAKAFAFNII